MKVFISFDMEGVAGIVDWSQCRGPGQPYEEGRRLLLGEVNAAIDVVVPIINVHQDSYWGPNGHAPWGTVLIVFSWLGTGFGWALATLAVAGYTGLARSSDTL